MEVDLIVWRATYDYNQRRFVSASEAADQQGAMECLGFPIDAPRTATLLSKRYVAQLLLYFVVTRPIRLSILR